jgi:hypothetical protein
VRCLWSLSAAKQSNHRTSTASSKGGPKLLAGQMVKPSNLFSFSGTLPPMPQIKLSLALLLFLGSEDMLNNGGV